MTEILEDLREGLQFLDSAADALQSEEQFSQADQVRSMVGPLHAFYEDLVEAS